MHLSLWAFLGYSLLYRLIVVTSILKVQQIEHQLAWTEALDLSLDRIRGHAEAQTKRQARDPTRSRSSPPKAMQKNGQ
jgi:hypothetical protein